MCYSEYLCSLVVEITGMEFYSWHRAAMDGDTAELDHSLAVSPFLLNNTSVFSWTALTTAVIFNQHDAAKFLLERGALVDHEDEDLSTPLHEAAYWGYEMIVKLLLAHDADAFSADTQGMLPVDLVPSSAHNVRRMLMVSCP